MATEIGVWQIVDGKLESIDISMTKSGNVEKDFENWVKYNPVILSHDMVIIGEQVHTKSGPLDLLGIDKSGNLIVIELKRERLPREALAQAVDYVSDVASWDLDKINEVCLKYTEQTLEDYLNEKFGDVDLENLTINGFQRILLVGFAVDESLERMIEWLSNNYGVNINVLVLKYIKTISGDELLARTMIIPENIEKERSPKEYIKPSTQSDEPGNYSSSDLEELLRAYLSKDGITPKRIKDILIPLTLENDLVTREMLKKELIERGETSEEGKAGIIVTTISKEIGFEPKDYLRQIIQYDKPNPWEKENYRLVNKYRNMVQHLLKEINDNIKNQHL